MKKTRILLVGMPTMLLDILTEVITSQRDFEVVATMTTAKNVGPAARRARATVIIAREAGGDAELGPAVLISAQRSMKVITLAEDGQQGYLCELRPHRVALGEMSADRLLAAIRVAAESE